MLWAWERPENLTFTVPQATGIAYLAETIRLEASTMQIHRRMQPLRLAPGTPLIAVVRLESKGGKLPAVEFLAREIGRMAGSGPIRAVQIDFDARASEHGYYRSLLEKLRQLLPREMAIEITALVSWCQGDRWMRGLPIADAVPMYFRMGSDPHSISEPLQEPLCLSAVGISTDEFYVHVPRGRKVYVFNPRPWTEADYRAILQASKTWRE